jgi:outer membrane protein assembly factor BamB
LAFGFASEAAAGAADTSLTYQINEAHDGAVSLGSAFAPPLMVAWKQTFNNDLTANDKVISFPVVAGGMVFVTVWLNGPGGTKLYALDLGTGQIVWSQKINGRTYYANATYSAGKVFVINSDGLLQAFAADSGALVWKAQVPGPVPVFSSPPVADGSQVFVGGYSEGGKLYAFDAATGAVNWWRFVSDGGGDKTAPTIGGGGLFVSYACSAYKVDPATGHSLWEYHLHCEGGGGMTTVFHAGYYYVRRILGLKNIILDASSGERVAKFTTTTPPVFWTGKDGQQLVFLNIDPLVDRTLYAVDMATGKIVWSFHGASGVQLPPILINNDMIVQVDGGGILSLLNPRTGKVRWSGPSGGGIEWPGEGYAWPMTGLGAGGNTLLIPTKRSLIAFVPASAAGPPK